MAMAMNLQSGQRAERKLLITVAEWGSGTPEREVLGARVENSSIDLNADVQTSTDILGKNYTDVNKTQPQQSLDPSFIIGGSSLSEYLFNAVMEDNKAAYNNTFNVYIISAFISESTTGQTPTVHYKTVKHANCSIIPSSVGGDAFVAMPITVYFSNDITKGYVDKLTDDFTFTADVSV